MIRRYTNLRLLYFTSRILQNAYSKSTGRSLTAKFHYAIWSQTGSKLVADRFEAKFNYTILVADRSEAGRRPASSLLAS